MNKLIQNKKYFLTQLSAPIIFGVTLLGFAFLMGKYHPINTRDVSIFDYIKFLMLLGLPMLSMFLWGRFLVFLGILSKEEGRGYPFRKPWE